MISSSTRRSGKQRLDANGLWHFCSQTAPTPRCVECGLF